MIATFFSIALTAIVVGIGWPVVGRLDQQGLIVPAERLCLSMTFGLSVLYFLTYLVGFWRFDTISMTGLGAVMTVAAIPGIRSLPWRNGLQSLRQAYASGRFRSFEAIIYTFATCLIVSGLLQGLAPPNDYDSLLYHLALPRYDLERGFISVAWGHGLMQALHPEFTRNLVRFCLALSGPEAAQVMHGIISVFGAVAVAALAWRMQLSRVGVALSALLFIAIRVVVWEMGTVETDVPAAVFGLIAAGIYPAWRASGAKGLGVLFGIALGAAILTKLYMLGFAICLGIFLLRDVITGRMKLVTAAIGPVIVGVMILPHAIRNFWLTGNPAYPVLNSLFNPDKPDPLALENVQIGVGSGFVDFLMAPWNISIHPTLFDGMVLGAPYFLALLPMAFLIRSPVRHIGWLALVSLMYFAFWFWLLGQHARYLLPILPLLCILVAAGIVAAWDATRTTRVTRISFAAILAVLAANQLMFVGIYSIIRLPAGIGIMSAENYHRRTPTLGGAFFDVCLFIERNLAPGDHYISLLTPHSYYCPQSSVILTTFDAESRWWLTATKPPAMSRVTLSERIKHENVRFIVIQTTAEDRTTNASHSPVDIPVDITTRAFGDLLSEPLERLKPIFEGVNSRVYDAQAVLRLLRGSGSG